MAAEAFRVAARDGRPEAVMERGDVAVILELSEWTLIFVSVEILLS